MLGNGGKGVMTNEQTCTNNVRRRVVNGVSRQRSGQDISELMWE
jgi:hypothetical protein